MDMRDQFTQPRHRYSQDDNARSRRRDYDVSIVFVRYQIHFKDRRSPRKYDEFRRPNNHRERRDYRYLLFLVPIVIIFKRAKSRNTT